MTGRRVSRFAGIAAVGLAAAAVGAGLLLPTSHTSSQQVRPVVQTVPSVAVVGPAWQCVRSDDGPASCGPVQLH
jgi:hypothetical protein